MTARGMGSVRNMFRSIRRLGADANARGGDVEGRDDGERRRRDDGGKVSPGGRDAGDRAAVARVGRVRV